MSGTSDKLEGRVKEGLGKVTADRDLESRGKGQHAVGSVKSAANDAKDKVKDTAEDAKDTVKDLAEDAKDEVSRSGNHARSR